MPFDFQTRLALSIEAGGCCAAPHCRRDIGRADDFNPLGDGAHICGSKPLSARYDANLPEPVRESEENGLWLCTSGHRMIDRFRHVYSAIDLHRWKALTAEAVRQRRGMRPSPSPGWNLGEEFRFAQAFLDDQRQAVNALWNYRAECVQFPRAKVVLRSEVRREVTRLVGPCIPGPLLLSQGYMNRCYSPVLEQQQAELLRLLQTVADLPQFRASARDVSIDFSTEVRTDFQGFAMECPIHPAAAAIAAYLECYDDVSKYVATERMPGARLRPGTFSW